MNMKRSISLFLLLTVITNSFAQKLPVLKSNRLSLDIRDGDKLRKNRWNIDSKTKPDIFETTIDKKYKWVTFISDVDSIRFKVKAGKSYPFIVVLNEKDSAYTRIDGIKNIPGAQFNRRYVTSHDQKSFVEIPQVYELFNIISALTAYGRKDNGLIIKNTKYYEQVLQWFDAYKDEPVVKKTEQILAGNLMAFVPLKMDAYAFEMNGNGKITQSKVYDRINTGRVNTLKPFLAELQSFSDKSGFQRFYKENTSFYNDQIRIYKDSIGLQEMQKWLTYHFPSAKYNSFKVIFSPLAGNIQSAAWFENNGFKEAQAHVNFPYRNIEDEKDFSVAALKVKDGNIVFTELNHSFINPEGKKPSYQKSLAKAFSDLSVWNEKTKPAGQYYNNAYACFNEYMNWGLTSLRYLDYAPAAEQGKLIANIEKKQSEIRGFKKFGLFNQYLIKIYRNRAKGQTIADLYPLIVKWFEDNK